MKSLVIYESAYGNTEAIARAVAEGIGRSGEVRCLEVSQSPEGAAEGVDLLVLGAPTQGHGMSSPTTRRSTKQDAPSIGIRELLEGLPSAPGAKAAAFDTRFDKPRWLTGSAALKIAKRLDELGYQVVLPPESFFVEHTQGPLREGEESRATRWGIEVARHAAEQVIA